MTGRQLPPGLDWSGGSALVLFLVQRWRSFRGYHPRYGRRRKVILTLLVLLGLFPAVVAGSFAVWTVAIVNPGNTFSTNTILLQDNQGAQAGSATSAGTAIFSVTNLEPNSSVSTQCIGVNFSGTAAISSLTLTAALGGAGQATLEGQLTMNVATYNTTGAVTTDGTNNNSGSCASYPGAGGNTTIGAQGATLAVWAAASPYTIAGPVTNTWYKFTVSGLPAADSSCATYCNKTITIALTWTLTTT